MANTVMGDGIPQPIARIGNVFHPCPILTSKIKLPEHVLKVTDDDDQVGNPSLGKRFNSSIDHRATRYFD